MKKFKTAPDFWYKISNIKHIVYVCVLLPLSMLYLLMIFIKKLFYTFRWLKIYKAPIPLIVVGNLTVGGVGKTPLVIWLAQQLQLQGLSVGIVSRGYGRKTKGLFLVSSNSDVNDVGDEALIIVSNTNCAMVVGEKRVLAIKYLLSIAKCDVILSDDGLQHYAMNRDYEIVVVDANRQFGNNLCFPAGPLREPLFRLKHIDCIVHNITNSQYNTQYQQKFAQYQQKYGIQNSTMNFVNEGFYHVKSMNEVNQHKLSQQNIIELILKYAKKNIYIVTGIGNPERFIKQFSNYESLGFNVKTRIFPDHYAYDKEDFSFLEDENDIVIMTEKDAVKCKKFAQLNWFFLQISLEINMQLDFLKTNCGVNIKK